MGVHPSGDGVAWDSLEAVDVDQPHGLDYQYAQHLSKAVRKRINKEHEAFGDTTAGGEHSPGKCGVCLVCDDTADFTAFVDATTAPLGCFAYCISHANLWCMTGTASGGSPDVTVIKLGPQSFCLGDDYTWTGAHEFDGSVDISGNVTIEGDLSLEGTLLLDSSADFSDVYIEGEFSVDGTADFGADVAFVADVSIDGTLAIQDTVLTGDSTFTFDPIAGETGPIFKILGDWSSRAQDTTYTARTDGFVSAYDTNSAVEVIIQTPAGTERVRSQTDLKDPGASCVVKGGDTWAAVADPTNSTITVFWIPFGDNT